MKNKSLSPKYSIVSFFAKTWNEYVSIWKVILQKKNSGKNEANGY